MLHKTKAIVLHSVKYAESSLIVHTYTREHGRMAYIVNGTKSKKSALRNSMLQPLSLLELDTEFNPKKEIQRIKECRLDYAFQQIQYDASKNALAIFIAELIYRSLREPHADEDLFDFLYNSVCKLDSTEQGLGNFHLCFLIQFSRHMGFAPQHDSYTDSSHFDLQNGIFTSQIQAFGQYLNKFDSSIFAQLCKIDYHNMSSYSLSKDDKRNQLNHMLAYYKLHVPHFSNIKSLDIIYQLFN